MTYRIFILLTIPLGLALFCSNDQARTDLKSALEKPQDVSRLILDNPPPTLLREIGRFRQLEHLEIHINKSGSFRLRLRPEDLRGLRVLILSGFSPDRLPGEIGELTSLEELDVSCSPLTTGGDEIPFPKLRSLSRLRRLRLRGCLYTGQEDALPAGAPLRELDLSNNRLSRISLPDLCSLRTLNLFGNELQALPTGLSRCGQLRLLDISANHPAPAIGAGQKPAPDFTGLAKLEILRAESDGWRNLPATIGRLTTLREIYLDNNRLKRLPAEIGGLKELRVLHLSNNRLQKVPEELGNLQNLRELDLSYNRLTGLPVALGRLRDLRLLNLSGNRLSQLPPALFSLVGLRRLVAADAGLQTLPPAIGKLVELQELNLSGNDIRTLPLEFTRLESLRVLRLGDSRISLKKRRQLIDALPRTMIYFERIAGHRGG